MKELLIWKDHAVRIKMDDIVFSLIIPVYNVESYLKKCLDSIVNQTFERFEILLINDGSTDGSEKICQLYKNEHSFIRYFSKPNGGLSSARNYGIRQAKGQYLVFIDSDDFLTDKDVLVKINQYLNNNIDLLMYLPKEYNEDLSREEKIYVDNSLPLYRRLYAKDVIDTLYSKDSPYITMAQTKVIKREFLQKNDLMFTEGIYHEDDEWIARVLLKYPFITITNLVGYGYRHRENSIISTNDKSRILKKCRDRVRIVGFLLQLPNAHEYRALLTYFIYYYIQTFRVISRYPDYANEFLTEANNTNVISAMRFSLRLKHHLLYEYSMLFGKEKANIVIMKKFVRLDS